MLAALVWPDKSQAKALARRTVNRMTTQGLITARKLAGTGVDAYVLTSKGAKLLSTEKQLKVTSGVSLPLGNTVHRACANWFCILSRNNALEVWAEHQIQTGQAPVSGYDGKVPDALIGSEYGMIWVEVENAWKSRAEREKIVRFCSDTLGREWLTELTPNRHLFRVVIVATNPSALKSICESFADAYRRGWVTDVQMADIYIALLPVSSTLTPGELVEGSLWYDGVLPILNA